MKSDPIVIYTHVLDNLTIGMLAGDIEACLNFLALPFTMHLVDQTHVCVTRANLIDTLETYHQTLQSQGVTDLNRTTEDARFVGPDKIEGYHITEPRRNGVAVIDPYPIRSVLVRRDLHWISTEQECLVSSRDWRIVPRLRGKSPSAGHSRNGSRTRG